MMAGMAGITETLTQIAAIGYEAADLAGIRRNWREYGETGGNIGRFGGNTSCQWRE